MKNVGAKLNASTNFTKHRCLLQNQTAHAFLGKPDCSGQAANATAGNQDWKIVVHVTSSLLSIHSLSG
jgi:hypothetical protein